VPQPVVVSGVGPSSMQDLVQRVAQVYQLVDPNAVISCPAGGAPGCDLIAWTVRVSRLLCVSVFLVMRMSFRYNHAPARS